jgi:putative ABC transport system permease protein
MRFFRRVRRWLKSRQPGDELAQEMSLHREMLEEQFMRDGMTRNEARTAALRQFGSEMAALEFSRDQWSLVAVESVIKDLRFAWRLICRQPLLTLAAVLTIAAGVGANTAIYSVVQTVLLNPLGLRDADRVLVAKVNVEKIRLLHAQTSAVEFRELQEMGDTFSAVAAIEGHWWTSEVSGEATRLVGRAVTPDFFRVFNVRPEIGRFLAPEDSQTAVLSYALWQSQYGGDRSAIGQVIMLDGVPHRIAGVAPASFRFPVSAQLWTPLIMSPTRLHQRGMAMGLDVVARLKDGVSAAQARDRVNRYVEGLKAAAGGRELVDYGYGIELQSFSNHIAGDLRKPIWLLWAAAFVVLIAACANVAGLLLTRSSTRRTEIAIRCSLGASRARIVRQLLLESLLLGLLGGAAGLGIAAVALPLFTGMTIPGGQALRLVAMNKPLLLYGLCLSLLTGVVFGLAPAIQLARGTQSSALVRGRRRRFQDVFIVLQVGGAFVLVVYAAMFLRSLWAVQQISPGFDARNLTTAYLMKPENDPGFLDRLQLELRVSPGVQSAALVYPLPFQGGGLTSGFNIRNREQRPGEPEWHGEAYLVSQDYMPMMRIPLLRGRGILDSDTAKAPQVCVIDSKFADRFFPHQDPINQEIAMYGNWARIVGVVGAIRGTTLEEGSRPVVYYSLSQIPFFPSAAVVVRSTIPAGAAIRAAVRHTNASVPVFDVKSMEDRISESLGVRRMLPLLLWAFGGITLLLATVGLYGVVAQTVTERTQEIGLRMALGAERLQIMSQFIREGLRSGVLGLAFGVAAAIYGQKWLSGMLYQAGSFDAASFCATGAGVLCLLSLALWWPARRAARIDPYQALRHE